MSYLECNTPYDTILEPGVREAIALFAPQLGHVQSGTVIEEGKNKLTCLSQHEAIEGATLVVICNEVIVKYGQHVSYGQVGAMQLVRELTSLPVPKVFGFHESENGWKYIVMEYLKGSDLDSVWDSLTVSKRETFLKQIKVIYDELHSVKGTYIGGVGKLAPEGYTFWGVKQKGPYESEQHMNEAIVCADRRAWRNHGGSAPDIFVQCTLPYLPSNHEIVLSHGLVKREHFLVDMTREEIVGDVGWSEAGFFPGYWDYVRALYRLEWGCEWIEHIHKFLRPYPKEYILWYRILKML